MRCLLLTQLNESRVDGMDNDRVSIDHEGMCGVEGERERSGTGDAGGGNQRSREGTDGWMDGMVGWWAGCKSPEPSYPLYPATTTQTKHNPPGTALLQPLPSVALAAGCIARMNASHAQTCTSRTRPFRIPLAASDCDAGRGRNGYEPQVPSESP